MLLPTSILLLVLGIGPPDAGVIEGLYLEERSNHVHGCYCEWSGESQTGGREAILGWQFVSGEYHGIDLAGARAALIVRGERTLSIGASQRQSVIILDSSASPEQRRAMESLIRDKYGFFIGNVLRVAEAGLSIEVNGEGARLLAPGLAALSVRKAVLPEDALPGAIRWYDPFVPLRDPELGTTELSRYSGREFNFTWSRTEPSTSAYFGHFVLYMR